LIQNREKNDSIFVRFFQTFVGKTIQQKPDFVENAPGMAYDHVNIVSVSYRFCLDFCLISYYF